MRSTDFITEEKKVARYNGLLMGYAFNNNELIIKAFTKEGPVSYVRFVKENKELYPQNLWVNDEYRNRGIAKSMYDFLKSEGYVINRSHDQTKAGSRFWDKHRGEDAYVWEEVLDEMPLIHNGIESESLPINEISRLEKREYTGGRDVLRVSKQGGDFKKLPGGSGLLYTIDRDGSYATIKLWDPSVARTFFPYKSPYESYEQYAKRVKAGANGSKEPNIIGKLTLEPLKFFPLKGALQVYAITVDEDYRGMGLAKAMYGIVLTIMKRPLIAGDQQTPGGRRSWVSLSQIPGVEVKGYIAFNDSDLDPLDHSYTPDKKKVERRLDTIMGELGGQYLGISSGNYHYFAFDVEPTTSGNELKAHVKQNLAKVYDNDVNFVTGLYAIWTGS